MDKGYVWYVCKVQGDPSALEVIPKAVFATKKAANKYIKEKVGKCFRKQSPYDLVETVIVDDLPTFIKRYELRAIDFYEE